MKTAVEMYQFSAKQGSNTGNKNKGIKHFQIIASNLAPGEEVKMAFMGLHNYQSATQHDDVHAYAVTDSRIMIARVKMIGQTFHVIKLEHLNSVSLQSGVMASIITFNTLGSIFNVWMVKKCAQGIFDQMNSFIATASHSTAPIAGSGVGDQLREIKELLDSGVITFEDFETKKKQLLSI